MLLFNVEVDFNPKGESCVLQTKLKISAKRTVNCLNFKESLNQHKNKEQSIN